TKRIKLRWKRKFSEKLVQEEERLKNKRLQTNLRSFVKNQVQNIREGSVIAQRERDRKVLNRQINLQLKWRKRALMNKERYDRLFFKHMSDKYETDEMKKQKEIELARRDMLHMNDVCRERELEKMRGKRKKAESFKVLNDWKYNSEIIYFNKRPIGNLKVLAEFAIRVYLEEFWERKVAEQVAWVEKGFELERAWLEEREANVNRRKNRVVPPLRKAKKPEAGRKTLEEILKYVVETPSQKDEEQQASTLDSKSTLDSASTLDSDDTRSTVEEPEKNLTDEESDKGAQIITEKPEEAPSVQETEVILKLGSEKNQIEEDSENQKSILKKTLQKLGPNKMTPKR
ncbi:hypothetical protein CEXT_651631, partial [Caerostris extrusa]